MRELFESRNLWAALIVAVALGTPALAGDPAPKPEATPVETESGTAKCDTPCCRPLTKSQIYALEAWNGRLAVDFLRALLGNHTGGARATRLATSELRADLLDKDEALRVATINHLASIRNSLPGKLTFTDRHATLSPDRDEAAVTVKVACDKGYYDAAVRLRRAEGHWRVSFFTFGSLYKTAK